MGPMLPRRLCCPAAAILALLALFFGAATASAASAVVTWDAVPPPNPVDGYKIYYDVDSGPPYDGTDADQGPSPIDVPVGSLADPTAPELELTGLATCQIYYIAVTAYDTTGESAYSAEAPVAARDAPDPVSVTGLTPEALEVSWPALPASDTGSVRYYEVHYDTDSGEPYRGPGSPIVVPPNTLSNPDNPTFVLSSLATGTTYYIAVRTVCAGNEGAMSAEVQGTPTGGGATGGSSAGGSGTGNGGTGASGNSGGAGAAQGLPPDLQTDQTGCSCRIDDPSGRSTGWLPVAVVALLLGWRRRR